MNHKMRTLKQNLRYVDIFGQNITLNLEGENKYRTATGGFVTIFILVISMAYFESTIVSFLNMEKVKAVKQIQFEETPDVLRLTDENFMFAVQVQQPNYVTRPFFNITVKSQTQTTWPNGTQTKNTVIQNLIPCTFDRFDNVQRKKYLNFSSQFDKLGLSQWLCPSRGFNYLVGGRFTNDLFQYLKIEVTACVNGSSQPWSPTCAPPSEIQQYLQDNSKFQVKFYVTNYIVNADQRTNYMQGYLDDELFFYFVPNQIFNAVDIFLKKYIVKTNEQIFPLIGDQKEDILYVKEQNDFVQRVSQGSLSDTIYVSLFFRRSPYQVIQTRSFQQFTDIMSLMGGFINVLLMIFGVIIGFYNIQQCMNLQYEDRFKIANKVYNFDYGNTPHIEENTKEKRLTGATNGQGSQIGTAKNKDGTVLLPFRRSKFLQQQELIVEKLGFKSRRDYLSAQIQGILSRSHRLRMKVKFLINQMTCNRIFSNDRKCQLFNRASQQIDQDLDIYVILEKIKEVNLLKELMLTPDQQILFNFTPKPVISIREEMKVPTRSIVRGEASQESPEKLRQSVQQFGSIANVTIRQKNHKHRFAKDIRIFNNLYQAYERIISDKQSQINGILINKLGKEIKDIFEVSRFIDFDHIHQNIKPRFQVKLKSIVVKIRQKRRSRLLHELLDSQINDEHEKELGLFTDQLARFEVDMMQRNITSHKI